VKGYARRVGSPTLAHQGQLISLAEALLRGWVLVEAHQAGPVQGWQAKARGVSPGRWVETEKVGAGGGFGQRTSV